MLRSPKPNKDSDKNIDTTHFYGAIQQKIFSNATEVEGTSYHLMPVFELKRINGLRTNGSVTNLESLKLRLSQIKMSGPGNLLILSAGISASGEFEKSAVAYYPSALALYSFSKSSALRWNLGLAYSYVFGKGGILPLLGMRYELSKNFELQILLPAHIKINQFINSEEILSYFIRANGMRSKVKSADLLSGPNELANYQERGAEMGIGYETAESRRNQFNVELGAMLARKIKIMNSTSSEEFKINNSLYARIGFLF